MYMNVEFVNVIYKSVSKLWNAGCVQFSSYFYDNVRVSVMTVNLGNDAV